MTTAAPLAFRHYFANLQDPRCVSRTTCAVLDLVFMAFCAVVAGAKDFAQVAAFARERQDWLRQFCQLPPTGETPSHDTFERLFKRLRADRFARCFGHWAAALADQLGLKQVAIDGKTLRGSARAGAGLRGLHLVSAWATENHLSLAQVAVDEKSNEITALPALLELLGLKGALVTLDAMGWRKEVARRVVEGGGDYVLVVKKNQGGLYDDILETFAYAVGMSLDPDIFRKGRHSESSTGHGRVERRDYLVLANLGLIGDRDSWPGLCRIGRCVHEREANGEHSREVRYFIGSRAMSARDYGQALRGHWGIENNLHWQLDVSFGEDANRVAERNAAENLSSLRRHALALLKRHPDKASIAVKQYSAALSPSFLQEVLESGETG